MTPAKAWLPSLGNEPRDFSDDSLVSRFRSSHHRAAASFANFGIEGHYQLIDLVWLWFRSPHFGLAARMMRTSEPPSILDFIGEMHHMSRTCRAHTFALIGERSRYLDNRRLPCQSASGPGKPRTGR